MRDQTTHTPRLSSTIIATSKRRLQAAIRATRCEALRDSICGYARLFGSILSADFLRSVDQTPRNRHFGQLPVFWAWLAQILEGKNCKLSVPLCEKLVVFFRPPAKIGL